MNVLFRADSSKIIGSGHIQRCLNLADNFSSFGIKSFFLCSNFSGNLNYLIKTKYQKKIIPPKLKFNENYRSTSTSVLQADAKLTIKYAKKIKAKFIVLDSFLLNHIWQSKIIKLFKLVFIDDLNIKNNCSVYINQHHRNKKISERNFLNKFTKKLIGPKFLIINKKQIKTKFNSKSKKIFIYMGDVDSKNYTGKILNLIKDGRFDKHKFIIICGTNYTAKKKLFEDSKQKKNIQIIDKRLKSIWNMFNLKNDIIICSGGLIGSEAIFLDAKLILVCQNNFQINNLSLKNKILFKNVSCLSKQKLFNSLDKLSLLKKYKKKISGDYVTRKILENV
tara:strand:+ start:344 stop:1348 length:1005 start_codon:yes stop_codon:yes gene_type:complete